MSGCHISYKVYLFSIIHINLLLFSAVALRPNAGHGHLILLVFQITHNDAPQSVGLLWTSYQLVAETSTCQHTTLTTDNASIPPVGFEPSISAGKWPQSYALDSAATGTGIYLLLLKVHSRQHVSALSGHHQALL